MTDPSRVRRALISVSDKTSVVELASRLEDFGVEILSTGGTARLLSDNGVPVIEVSDYTGYPELMDGRVKTLHPRIHGGVLGRRGVDDAAMAEQNIPPIDMVVVNLYPFRETIARKDCNLQRAIENIDIGGPSLLRAAAKNYTGVSVVVDPADYERIVSEMGVTGGGVPERTRFELALKAFEHTAAYDDAIAEYLGSIGPDKSRSVYPRTLNRQFRKTQDMRYGENPHQSAAFYVEAQPPEPSIATATQLQGKELSFNNVADADAALECVKQFERPACVIAKHANPCGVAVAKSACIAYQRAFQTDPTSAFGGIIAFNRPMDGDAAAAIVQRQFVEVVIAPAVTDDALRAFAGRENVRILASGSWGRNRAPGLDFRRVNGGLLVQERDIGMIGRSDLEVVTRRAPKAQELSDLLFAWRVVKWSKSNAIVYAHNEQTIGIGAGQMSRVYSAKIAAMKAADEALDLKGSVMASDAFFPFRDGVDIAAEAGVKAIIQPGGSKRDADIIAAADEYGIAMVFTGMRHFRH